jgi:hypothetical protein
MLLKKGGLMRCAKGFFEISSKTWAGSPPPESEPEYTREPFIE